MRDQKISPGSAASLVTVQKNNSYLLQGQPALRTMPIMRLPIRTNAKGEESRRHIPNSSTILDEIMKVPSSF